MAVVRLIILALGLVALLVGLLWIGQGMGWVRWPASSFMIDVSEWATRGAILALAGIVLILIGRRIGR